MGQRGGRELPIPGHDAQRNHSPIAAAARDLEEVVAHRLDLGGQGEGSVVGWLAHLENKSRTLA